MSRIIQMNAVTGIISRVRKIINSGNCGPEFNGKISKIIENGIAHGKLDLYLSGKKD